MADPALTTFVNERERLILIALRMVKSRAVAEELVQDSWLRWHEKSYPSEKALPIFRRIVSNLALDWTKSRKVEDRVLSELMLVEDFDFDPERIFIAREELDRVVKALEKLPKRTIDAFSMRYLDGATFAEIARQLNIPRPTAYSLVEKGLATIAYVFKA
ncbi:MAG: sigma-70 family RNA polymerase sigma factor [Pseudomonadota bacterium]